MRILLIGGGGQVGIELARALQSADELVVTSRAGGGHHVVLDVTDPVAISDAVTTVRPNVVVNATAYTAVDRAEAEEDFAFAVNARAPEAMARACASIGASIVHYSTDYVFDGSGSRPYREDDATSPLGVYGRSKLAGEEAIRGSHARHLILRTAWVYALHGHNFLRTMLRLGSERDELAVVADQVGSPTPAWLIADVTAKLLTSGTGMPEGVRHVVASGSTSWHGFAEAIFDEAVARRLVQRRPEVRPITTADYSTPARRPAYSVLSTEALQRDLAAPLPDWRSALALTFVNRPAA